MGELKLTASLSNEIKAEFREAATQRHSATAVGECLRLLEYWCDQGIPGDIECRIVEPGIVLYTLWPESGDLVCYVALKGSFLIPVAMGRKSVDDKNHEVLDLATVHCKTI